MVIAKGASETRMETFGGFRSASSGSRIPLSESGVGRARD
jgi:hypothetical protein